MRGHSDIQEHQQLLLVYQAHLIFSYPDHQAKEMVIKRKVKLMNLPGPSHSPTGHFTPGKTSRLHYQQVPVQLLLLLLVQINSPSSFLK